MKIITKTLTGLTRLLLVGGSIFINSINAQEAPSWVDFTTKIANGDLENSVLLDYSYAGYHHSEKEIPDISNWNVISVATFGAIPNDGNFDDSSIRAAISAAKRANVPTVIFFPPGRFMVSSQQTFDNPIRMDKSFIVIKGSGSGSGGTEIFAQEKGDTSKRWNTSWNFELRPSSVSGTFVTNIVNRVNRGDTEIQVSTARNLSVGMVISINQLSGVENVAVNIPNRTIKPQSEWRFINERGMRITERHRIKAISGNIITLNKPVNAYITADESRAHIETFQYLEEVGVEDILFTSGWKNHPEEFQHHKNDIVDYGWRALRFDNVVNGWIRNVEFRDWSEAISINRSMAVTVEDIVFSGKQGHVSSQASWSTDILFKNMEDKVSETSQWRPGQWHGPGLQLQSTGCVYLNFKMQPHQFIDFHGYQPYGNLLDNIQGGILDRNGGNSDSQPHAGPDNTFWNFKEVSDYRNKTYDFWVLSRNTQAYFPNPKFVGYRDNDGKTRLRNVGLNELQGQEVYPKSLFEAQLQLRLTGIYASASSEKDNAKADNVSNANTSDFWSPSGAAVGSNLVIDLGTAKQLYGVWFSEIGNAIENFKLEYLEGDQWKSIIPSQSDTDVSQWNFSQSISTRKLRITIEGIQGAQEVMVDRFTPILDQTLSSDSDLSLDNASFDFSIYPNSNNGRFTIALNNANAGVYSIYSISGVLVGRGDIQGSKQVELDLASGLYLVKVNTTNTTLVKKMVVR